MPTYNSRADFLAWIAKAEPGETATYHTGSLMHDRMVGARFLEVHSIAVAAWEKMEAGEITITQAKVRPGVFDYRAKKLPAPFKPVIWCGPYATETKKHTKPSRTSDDRKAFAMGCALGRDQSVGRPEAATETVRPALPIAA